MGRKIKGGEGPVPYVPTRQVPPYLYSLPSLGSCPLGQWERSWAAAGETRKPIPVAAWGWCVPSSEASLAQNPGLFAPWSALTSSPENIFHSRSHNLTSQMETALVERAARVRKACLEREARLQSGFKGAESGLLSTGAISFMLHL